jgi:hypothetical protein
MGTGIISSLEQLQDEADHSSLLKCWGLWCMDFPTYIYKMSTLGSNTDVLPCWQRLKRSIFMAQWNFNCYHLCTAHSLRLLTRPNNASYTEFLLNLNTAKYVFLSSCCNYPQQLYFMHKSLQNNIGHVQRVVTVNSIRITVSANKHVNLI